MTSTRAQRADVAVQPGCPLKSGQHKGEIIALDHQ
jgi:hypothetical protein